MHIYGSGQPYKHTIKQVLQWRALDKFLPVHLDLHLDLQQLHPDEVKFHWLLKYLIQESIGFLEQNVEIDLDGLSAMAEDLDEIVSG